MCRAVNGVSFAREIVFHPGVVQLNVNVEEQTENDSINHTQLQQHHKQSIESDTKMEN